MHIVVDVREPEGMKKAIERKFPDVKFEQLPYGDIEINGRVCIERKTPQDFIASIKDGRLFEQARGMKIHYDIPIIVVTGTLGTLLVGNVRRGMNDNAVMGAIVSLYVRGVPVLFVGNHFMWFIDRLVAYEQKNPYKRTFFTRKSGDYQLDVLMSFPQIGEQKALAILEKYDTLEDALAHIDDWKDIKGIGKKIVSLAKEVLTSPRRGNKSGESLK